MKEENFTEREFADLAQRLRGADLSADSRVKDVLKARLLAKALRSKRRAGVFVLLTPVFAATALFFLFGQRKAAEAPDYMSDYAYSYDMPDDAYGECGRRGLTGGREIPRF